MGGGARHTRRTDQRGPHEDDEERGKRRPDAQPGPPALELDQGAVQAALCRRQVWGDATGPMPLPPPLDHGSPKGNNPH